MRLFAIAFLTAVALLTTGIAAAGHSGVAYWATHAGVTCGFGTGPQGRGVACIRTTQKGYAVTLTSTKVIVWLNGHRVFARTQK